MQQKREKIKLIGAVNSGPTFWCPCYATGMECVALVLIAFGVIGGLFLAHGLPQRSGATSHCRRCGSVLSNVDISAPEAACPSCGRGVAKPRAVIYGEWQRRWDSMLIGAFLLLVCFVGLAFVAPAAALLGLPFAVGIGLFRHGWFPRRTGTTPYCANCEYNLTGTDLAAGDACCPECGRSLHVNAILTGERRRSKGVAALGAGLLMLAMAGTAVFMIGNAMRVDWYSFYPTPLVTRDLQAPDARTVVRAARELERRVIAGLPQHQIERIARHCLEMQERAAGGATVIQAPLDLLGSLDARNLLSPDQRDRFLRNLVSAEVVMRAKIAIDDPCVIDVKSEYHGPTQQFSHGVRFREVRVNGEVQRIPRSRRTENSSTTTGYTQRVIERSHREPLLLPGVGVHEVSLELEIAVYDGWPPRGPDPMYARTMQVSRRIEVTDSPGFQAVRAVPNESLRSVLEEKLGCRLDAFGDHGHWRVSGSLVIAAQPLPLAFDAFIEFDNQRHAIGSVLLGSGNSSSHWRWFEMIDSMQIPSRSRPAALQTPIPSHVTLLLKSNPKVAVQALDISEFWDGEVRIENVKIERSPSPAVNPP